MKSEVSDNKIIFKAPTAGVYKFDNGKVNLIVKAADGCPECFNLAQELLKEKEAYEKLKAQLERAEVSLDKALSSAEFFSRHADCRRDSWSCRCEFCKDNKASKNLREAREYFKEINKGESK